MAIVQLEGFTESELRRFESKIGGYRSLLNFMNHWATNSYDNYLYPAWGLLTNALEKHSDGENLWNSMISKMARSDDLGPMTIIQDPFIRTWIRSLGFQMYVAELGDESQLFFAHKFHITSLNYKETDLREAIDYYLRTQSTLYPKEKLYAFDTIINPLTEFKLGQLLKNELGFEEIGSLIQLNFQLTNDLLIKLSEIQTDSNIKIMRFDELLKHAFESESPILSSQNISYPKFNTKKPESGFDNTFSFYMGNNALEHYYRFLHSGNVPFWLRNIWFAYDVNIHMIVGQLSLASLPLYEIVPVPTRRISTFWAESVDIKLVLLKEVFQILSRQNISNVLSYTSIFSPEREIFEKYLTVDASSKMFSVMRKPGRNFSEVEELLAIADTIDYMNTIQTTSIIKKI